MHSLKWLVGHEEDRYSLRATASSMKVNGFEIISLVRPAPLIYWLCVCVLSWCLLFAPLPNSEHLCNVRFGFLSLSISISDRFCYGLQRVSVFGGLYKKIYFVVVVGIGIRGYCILCTTMPRINWLLLNWFDAFFWLSLSPRAFFFPWFGLTFLLSIVDICFSPHL